MIIFDDVSKTYLRETTPALSKVSATIDEGEFVFLVGPSGSGKSTFLKLILRELRPTRGTVQVAGMDVGALSQRRIPFLRRKIGTVFQDFRLLPDKTVYQNVAFALRVIGASRAKIKTAVPDVLDMVGLGDKGYRMPHELSGGEQQRIALARAVVNSPQLLIADEPTGNLDPDTSQEIMQLINDINAKGTTVVMATHNSDIVNQMRRRVLELSKGELIRDQGTGVYSS